MGRGGLGELGWRGLGAAAPVKAPWEPVNCKPNALANVVVYRRTLPCVSFAFA